MSRLRQALSFLGRFVLVFLVAEGLFSSRAVFVDILKTLRESPRLATRYDALLGWVATPNVSRPDQFGPGAGLHTNSRGFRGARETEAPPSGHTRIVCSGDSFTLGVGVGDAETWCAGLESLVPGIETVNMAQGGYGVDQAYLWFKRDGAMLGQKLFVLGLVSIDLDRMLVDRFSGFPKPFLEIENGALVTRNVPVPQGPYLLPWATLLVPRLDGLRSVAWARSLVPAPAAPARPRTPPADLFLAVVADLKRINEEHGSRLAIAYLPTIGDCAASPALDRFRARLRSDVERAGVAYVDLVEDFRGLAPTEIDRMYLPTTVMGRHYSVAGNAFVARLLADRLVRPLIASAP